MLLDKAHMFLGCEYQFFSTFNNNNNVNSITSEWWRVPAVKAVGYAYSGVSNATKLAHSVTIAKRAIDPVQASSLA